MRDGEITIDKYVSTESHQEILIDATLVLTTQWIKYSRLRSQIKILLHQSTEIESKAAASDMQTRNCFDSEDC